ncbi:MAG: hypothetical protein RIF34_03865, partial [Candidatus Kapaibacterium sp.]
ANSTLDNGNIRGFDYAMTKHGANSTYGSNKSKFSISNEEVKSLLQDKRVVKSHVYNPINPATGLSDPNKFVRQVDVGRRIGTTNVGGVLQSTSKITVITNRKGNLINVFPGSL